MWLQQRLLAAKALPIAMTSMRTANLNTELHRTHRFAGQHADFSHFVHGPLQDEVERVIAKDPNMISALVILEERFPSMDRIALANILVVNEGRLEDATQARYFYLTVVQCMTQICDLFLSYTSCVQRLQLCEFTASCP